MTPVPKVGQVASKKPGLQAPMSVMVKTLLGLLCLLLSPAGASEEGEVCLGWLPIPVEGFQSFRCPQRLDGKDGRFCCGTCIAPYCCDSEEARLEQDQCLYVRRTLQFFVLVLTARRERATLPAFQDLETTTTSQPNIRKVRSFAGEPPPAPRRPKSGDDILIETLVILFCIMATTVVVVIEFICVCCPERCPPCLRPRHRVQDAPLYFPMRPRHGSRPSDYGPPPEVAPALGAAVGGTVTPDSGAVQEAADGGEATAERESAGVGEMTPVQAAAARGETPPVQAAAAGGEMTPVEEAAGGGKVTAAGDPAGGGEDVSPLVSSAPDLISAQPVPVQRTISGSPEVIWEVDESEV